MDLVTKRRLWPLALAAVLSGCVAVPDANLPAEDRPTTLTNGVFQDLDAGAKEESGLHFRVKAYGSDHPGQVLQTAEMDYQRIMNDTGLYSFSPQGLYQILIYSNADEFHKKTQYALWAVGLTVGNSIYSFDGPGLNGTLAHEMTHLIFHEYMGDSRPDLRWLNEGLAMYEQGLASGLPGSTAMPGGQIPIPFDQMMTLTPATERDRDVVMWYRQVSDVVGFMILRGGRMGFGQFLQALRDHRAPDDAIRTAFAGTWNSMSDLENAWKTNLANSMR